MAENEKALSIVNAEIKDMKRYIYTNYGQSRGENMILFPQNYRSTPICVALKRVTKIKHLLQN